MNPISHIEATFGTEGEDTFSAEIDVWAVSLETDEDTYNRLLAMLSLEECHRARRFRQARDSRWFVLRRGMLRELLGRELGCDPRDVRILADEFGKPAVEGSNLRFNLSHSRGIALYVLTRNLQIGCDLERLNSPLATDEAAELVLSPAERDAWNRTEGARREATFLRYWTCKEAYLKARGIGLEAPLCKITVSEDDPARFVSLPDDDPSAWSLATFCPATGSLAALVVRDPLSNASTTDPVARNRSGAKLSLRAARQFLGLDLRPASG